MKTAINFADRLAAAVREKRTAAVVGIDPVLERLPVELCPREADLAPAVDALEEFGRAVVDAVSDYVPAVKINSGFFEAFQEAGVGVYYRLIAYAHRRGLLVIGDVKRGDIGSTAKLYARGHLAESEFPAVENNRIPDAVTLAGYLGINAVRPFIEQAREHGRGIYILVRPSDPGADEVHEFGPNPKFYQHMARLVHAWGADESLCGECGLSCVGAVVAPKDGESTAALRKALPHTPFLVPGFGAQGASADSCGKCFLPGGGGAVVNASRSVIYAYENAGWDAGDWRGCISHACRSFAADIAPLAGYRSPERT